MLFQVGGDIVYGFNDLLFFNVGGSVWRVVVNY